MAQWDAIRTKATTCQSTRELISQDTFAFLWESDDDINGHAAIFKRSSLEKDQKEQLKHRASIR